MEDVFIALALMSLVCFFIPNTFSLLFGNKLSEGKIRLVFVLLTVVFFIAFGITSNSNHPLSENKKVSERALEVKQASSKEQVKTEEVKSDTQSQEAKPEIASKQKEIVSIKIPKYEISYEIRNQRYDGGIIYFVLINPINLANDSFKSDIKLIIKDIVKEKGGKISISIFDSKNILKTQYDSLYTTKAILNKSKLQQRGFHMIASYSGEMSTMPSGMELSFFPGAFTDDVKVGRYVESMEFNPSN